MTTQKKNIMTRTTIKFNRQQSQYSPTIGSLNYVFENHNNIHTGMRKCNFGFRLIELKIRKSNEGTRNTNIGRQEKKMSLQRRPSEKFHEYR